MTDSTATPSTNPRLNPAQRLVGVVVSPDQTFRDIAVRPDWILPLILILLIGAFFGFVMTRHVDFETAAREQAERSGANGAEVEERLEMAIRIQRVTAPIFGAVGYLISLLVVAGVLMLAAKLFAGTGTFRQTFSVTCYSWIPQALKAIIVAGLLVRAGMTDLRDIALLLRSNLGFLAHPDDSPFLFIVLTSVDVFAIWAIALLSIGLSHAHKLKRSTTAVITISLFFVVVIARALIAAATGVAG